MKVSIALAFSAGLLATVNPCGFAMLPAYLSFFLGAEDGEKSNRVPARAAQGLMVGGVVTAGFVAVFGVAGLIISVGLRSVMSAVPWIALLIGLSLFVLGVAAASGRHIGLRLPSAFGPTRGGGYRSVFIFGLAYATASLSCTLPAFLSVIGATLAVGRLPGVPLLFLFYALGTASVLFAISISAALAKSGVARLVRRVIPMVERSSGAVLAAAGAYIVFYWSVSLANADGDGALRAPITALERVQSLVAGWLANSRGAIAALLVLSISIVVWTWIWWRRTATDR